MDRWDLLSLLGITGLGAGLWLGWSLALALVVTGGLVLALGVTGGIFGEAPTPAEPSEPADTETER